MTLKVNMHNEVIAHLEVREHRQYLHGSNSGFTVVLRNLEKKQQHFYPNLSCKPMESNEE